MIGSPLAVIVLTLAGVLAVHGVLFVAAWWATKPSSEARVNDGSRSS